MSLQQFLQSDNVEIIINVKNNNDDYKHGRSTINFIKLKSAPIVEKETTLKKQLKTNDIIYDSNNNNAGDIEYTLSIEDFGDIENQSASQSFANSIKNEQNIEEENNEEIINNDFNENINIDHGQQKFINQYTNMVNSSKQMQNMRKKYDTQINANANDTTDKS